MINVFLKYFPVVLVVLMVLNANSQNKRVLPASFKKETSKNITFTENKGQVSDQDHKPRPDVLFSGSANGMVYHLRNNGISYQLNKVDSWKDQEDYKTKEKIRSPDRSTIYRLDIDWLGINNNFITKTESALDGYNNYYLEGCPNGITNVKTYAGVFYKNIYNNIDLHYYQKNNSLKYDYIVEPGGNYKQIQLEIKGADKIELQPDGSLFFITPLGKIHEDAPIVYQNNKQLKAKWVIKKNILSFDIQNYDPLLNLVIDPAVRQWGTYYGGTNDDYSYACATDAANNVYISGYTFSNIGSVIATTGSYQSTDAGGYDTFLVKFDPDGVRQWGTYYGGALDDRGQSCAVDISGNIYIAGYTGSGTAISTVGSQQPTHGGGSYDSYLVKFDATGFRIWGTYYGGSGDDYSLCCITDAVGDVYISGTTLSTNGAAIATIGSHQTVNAGGTGDAFLVKFNSAGVRQWGTFYGGTGFEEGISCVTDPSGNIYLAGYTQTNTGTVIATTGSHQTIHGGGTYDAYLVKFNGTGVRQWGTYYGGAGDDKGYPCAIDLAGNVFMSGYTITNSGNSIATPGSHQPVIGLNIGSPYDAFLVKFNSTGARQWGTYYGTTSNDGGYACVTDGIGNVYLGGYSHPGTNTAIATVGSQQPLHGGGVDAYLAMFDATGVRQWGTYHGGNSAEVGYSCALDATGNIYLTGTATTNTTTGMTTVGSHQPNYGGGTNDGFLVKYCTASNTPLNTSSIADQFICANSSTTLFATGTATLGWYDASTGGNYLGGGGSYITPTLVTTTTYYVQDSSACSVNLRTPITVTVNPNPTITVSSGSVCEGSSFTLNPTGASSYTYSSGSPIVSPTVASTYSIIGTSSFGCIGTNTAVATITVNSVPVISVNNGTTCAGQSFTILPTGANTYTFSGGSAIVSPTTNTSYSVTGTSAFGCVGSNTAISNITVNSLPVIAINSTPSAICSGQSSTLIANGAITYTWNTASTNTTIVVSPTISSTYSVAGTNTFGCIGSLINNITVYALPTISVSNGTICSGNSFTIVPGGANTYTYSGGSAIVSPTANTNYTVVGTSSVGCISQGFATSSVVVNPNPTVSVNSGIICSGTSFTIIPNGASTYTFQGGNAVVSPITTTNYTVVGTNSLGCISNIAASNIVVNVSPTLSISLSPISGSICPPPTASSAFLNVSGANTYTWMPGNLVSNSPIVQPSGSTNYTVTGIDANGCSATATQFLFVHPPAILAVTAPTPVCSGTTACFSTSGDLVIFSWNGPCGDVSSQPNPCLIANTSCGSTYTVGGSNAHGCVATTTVNIVINASPTISAVSNSGLICTGQTVTLTAGGANTYTWNTAATTSVIVVSPTITTTYTVNGSSGNGCTDFATITQSVSACTGIQSFNSQSGNIKLYPNPTTSIINIELENLNTDTKIEIYNTLGQLVLKEIPLGINSTIDLQQLSNGLYTINIIKKGTVIFNSKIVKQ